MIHEPASFNGARIAYYYFLPILIVVGALHLVGQNSILETLKARRIHTESL